LVDDQSVNSMLVSDLIDEESSTYSAGSVGSIGELESDTLSDNDVDHNNNNNNDDNDEAALRRRSVSRRARKHRGKTKKRVKSPRELNNSQQALQQQQQQPLSPEKVGDDEKDLLLGLDDASIGSTQSTTDDDTCKSECIALKTAPTNTTT
jgi:hypothetical protein